MRYTLGCELGYDVGDGAVLILAIEVATGERQSVITESMTIEPGWQGEAFVAPTHGTRYRRMNLPAGRYTVRYNAQVELNPLIMNPADVPEIPVAELPLSVLPYLYPSRYCQSDRLARFAYREFGALPTGHRRVEAICNWIYREVDYLSGTSDSGTSAYDTFSLRAGVCRDFAHLGITFCRALGIPARFVSAYGWQVTPQDFHAVFEAYLGGRWFLFDATRVAPLDGLVRIATGRDAADSAFSTFYGPVMPQQVKVFANRDANIGIAEQWTTQAVSMSDS